MSFGTTTSRSNLAIPIEKLKEWFEKQNSPVGNVSGIDTSIFKPLPKWELAHTIKSPDGQAFTVIPIPSIGLYTKTQRPVNELGTANVIITKLSNNTYKASVVVTIADADYYAKKNGITSPSDYSGLICSFDAKGNFKSGIRLINGTYSGKVGIKKRTDINSATNNGSRECVSKNYIIAFPCLYALANCTDEYEFTVLECEDGINSGTSGSGAGAGTFTSGDEVGQGGGWAGNSGNGTPSAGGGFGGGGASNVPKSQEELIADAFSEAFKFADIMDKDAKNVGKIALSPEAQKKAHLVTTATWEEFAKKMNWTDCGMSGNITPSQQSYFLMNPTSFNDCNSVSQTLNVLQPMEDLGFKYPESRERIEEMLELVKANPSLLTEIKKYLDTPFSNKKTANKYLEYLSSKPSNPMSWEDFRAWEVSNDMGGFTETSIPVNNGPALSSKNKICPSSFTIEPHKIPNPNDPTKISSCGIKDLSFNIPNPDGTPKEDLKVHTMIITLATKLETVSGVSQAQAISNAINNAIEQLSTNILGGVPRPKDFNGKDFNDQAWFQRLININLRVEFYGYNKVVNSDIVAIFTGTGKGAILPDDYGSGRLGAQSAYGTVFNSANTTIDKNTPCF